MKNRFEAKLIPVPESGCWLWTACVQTSTGYGRFGVDSKNVTYAHRASWMIYRGTIPAGMYVCHKCDTRTCVNPDHLFLGTAVDNMRDCSAKGRVRVPIESYASDGSHQVAKLTNDDVSFIRSSPMSNQVLAKKYGVVYQTIWAARTYRTFRDVA